MPSAAAQPAGRVPVLGILSPHPKSMAPKGSDNPINTVLMRRGWKPGETLLIEYPDARGSEQRLAQVAAELAGKKVDVIWANGPEAAVAAARATSTIPIVFWGVMYPVEQGLIESFARPGRNLTGVAFTAAEESDGKRLELLREIAPAARRLAYLATPSARPGGPRLAAAAMAEAARALGYDLREFRVGKAEELEAAFAGMSAWGAQALVAQPSTFIFRERARIVDFANRNKLPSVFTLWDYVESGGLVAYAIDWRPTAARSFDYVDRILRGAKPAELPVDLPSKYVLAVNLRTARALGLIVPQSILLRADRVIE